MGGALLLRTKVYLPPPPELPPIPEPPLIPLPPFMPPVPLIPEPLPLGPAAVPLFEGSAPFVPDRLPLTLPAPVPVPEPGLVPVWAKDALASDAANAQANVALNRCFFTDGLLTLVQLATAQQECSFLVGRSIMGNRTGTFRCAQLSWLDARSRAPSDSIHSKVAPIAFSRANSVAHEMDACSHAAIFSG